MLLDSVKWPFIENGKVYGIGYAGYTMGLVYNKKLFTQAGSTRTSRDNWQEVAAAAKAIADEDPGTAGYSEYSAGNTGGWHFTASPATRAQLAGVRGRQKGQRQHPRGEGRAGHLKAMRFTDNSVGETQLQQWPDLLTNAAAGKVGMYIGAPDSITAIVTTFKGNYGDWRRPDARRPPGGPRRTGRWLWLLLQEGLTADQIKPA